MLACCTALIAGQALLVALPSPPTAQLTASRALGVNAAWAGTLSPQSASTIAQRGWRVLASERGAGPSPHVPEPLALCNPMNRLEQDRFSLQTLKRADVASRMQGSKMLARARLCF